MGKKKRRNLFRGLALIILFFFLVASGVALGVAYSYINTAPPFDPKKLKPSETSFVLDEKGNVVSELHGEQNRIPVSLEEIPDNLKNAFIAIEDQYFYSHKGINIRSIIGSLITDLIKGGYHRGASTITQQLVKNAFLTQEKSLKRKIQEAWLAIQLERHYTKNQILEFYLNQIYFGHSAYGVEAASQLFFGKHVKDLTLAECAMLAGVPKGPQYFSPYLNFKNAKERQELILDKMAELGYITKEEAKKAKEEKINLAGLNTPKANYKAPYFTDYVVQETAEKLQKSLGISQEEAYDRIYNGGLKIYTTIDVNIQEAAEKALSNPANYPYTKNDKNGIPQPQGAIVVLDVKTGAIKALVGGREHYQKLGLNRAYQSYRQPGSAFKPIVVYTAAIDSGFTAASVIDDSPVFYPSGSGTWSPQNFSGDYRGLTPLWKAIARSVNVAAVKVLDSIGVDRGIEYAKKLGIKDLVLKGSKNDRQLAIALGGLTKGVTPLELASAYQTLANQGVHIEPIAVLKIVDRNGRTLYEEKPQKWVAVSPQTAFIMTNLLKGPIYDPEGTARRLSSFPYPVRGKTGTTSDNKDVWFVGYTPYYVASVWIGHDEPVPMKGVSSGNQPANIWMQVMKEAHKNLPYKDFDRPDNIVGPIPVCMDSGKLPTELCYKDPRGPRVVEQYFIKGTEPTEFCDVHVELDVDITNGLLATPYCPPELVQKRVFIKRPPFIPSKEGKIPLDVKYQAPEQYCPVHSAQNPVFQTPVEGELDGNPLQNQQNHFNNNGNNNTNDNL
ncbi:transglycosylase domain-containing protein [Thermovenabulum sp.]|uniref:transglycosylase domain-containing protein n=1 Tax=Thermovenabulum sp. TaxID=3100335 RepID=UPI003C797D8F